MVRIAPQPGLDRGITRPQVSCLDDLPLIMKVVGRQQLSSDVLPQLRVTGEVLRVGQVCDGVMYLREKRSVPVCDAELLITINGRQGVHPVFLPRGFDAQFKTVEFF